MELLMEEETLFTKALGNSPTTRVLDLLILGRQWDYSLSNIEEGAGVGWTTLHEIIPRLMDVGMIKHTRCIGRAKLYQINEENVYAKMLVGFFDTLALDSIEPKQEKAIPH